VVVLHSAEVDPSFTITNTTGVAGNSPAVVAVEIGAIIGVVTFSATLATSELVVSLGKASCTLTNFWCHTFLLPFHIVFLSHTEENHGSVSMGIIQVAPYK